MPVSKKRKKPEKKRRARDERAAPGPHASAPAESASTGGGGGLLSRMRGGFQSVTGTGPRKKESLLSKIVTWALMALVAYFLARRFGIVK